MLPRTSPSPTTTPKESTSQLESNEASQPRHVVVNLDQELVVQALVETLQLLQELQLRPSLFSQACPRLSLRICYALLHSEHPEFRREEVRKLALHHSKLAESILLAQRKLDHYHRNL